MSFPRHLEDVTAVHTRHAFRPRHRADQPRYFPPVVVAPTSPIPADWKIFLYHVGYALATGVGVVIGICVFLTAVLFIIG